MSVPPLLPQVVPARRGDDASPLVPRPGNGDVFAELLTLGTSPADPPPPAVTLVGSGPSAPEVTAPEVTASLLVTVTPEVTVTSEASPEVTGDTTDGAGPFTMSVPTSPVLTGTFVQGSAPAEELDDSAPADGGPPDESGPTVVPLGVATPQVAAGLATFVPHRPLTLGEIAGQGLRPLGPTPAPNAATPLDTVTSAVPGATPGGGPAALPTAAASHRPADGQPAVDPAPAEPRMVSDVTGHETGAAPVLSDVTPQETGPAPATVPVEQSRRPQAPTAARPAATTDAPAAIPGLVVRDSGAEAGTAGGGEGRRQDGAGQRTETLATVAVGLAPVASTAYARGQEDRGPTGAITGQVFPEVARLVTRGDGMRRLTVKLNPEALGEVRVVLTVRNGEVHVRMTGSQAAHQALLNGAPELHRLLDRAGASSSHIVVGNNSAGSQSTERGTPQEQHRHQPAESSSQDATPDGAGRQTDHRTAGTRDGSTTSARDGTAGGTRPRSSPAPAAVLGGVTRARDTGVDVTM